MKKILVASPIRGGVSPSYVKALISLHFSKINRIMGGPNAPYEFLWAATSGTSVNLARDELADLALRGQKDTKPFDGILWWDVDLCDPDSNRMLSMFARLLSHIEKVDVVAGQYVGHNFLSHFHGATTENSTGPDADGLMEMSQIPIGFSYISCDALRKIREFHAHRTYAIKETEKQIARGNMFEFFPIGVCGPCSSEGKIERIKEIFKTCQTADDFMPSVIEVINDTNYQTNYLLGEDFYFCKLAREAGVKLYIDNALIIPHETQVRLPVKNWELLMALGEHWRLNNNASPQQMLDLVEQIRPILGNDLN